MKTTNENVLDTLILITLAIAMITAAPAVILPIIAIKTGMDFMIVWAATTIASVVSLFLFIIFMYKKSTDEDDAEYI